MSIKPFTEKQLTQHVITQRGDAGFITNAFIEPHVDPHVIYDGCRYYTRGVNTEYLQGEYDYRAYVKILIFSSRPISR